MTRRRIPLYVMPLMAAICLLLVLTGCADSSSRNDPLMKKGDSYREEGNPELAERFYRRFLEKHPENPAGHLALATLCDESLGNPARALYHYDEYLRLTPDDDPERGAVMGYRELVRAKLRNELNALAAAGGLPQVTDEASAAEIRRLKEQVEMLKRYILAQQQRIAALSEARPQTAAAAAPPASGAAPRREAVQNAAAPLPASSPEESRSGGGERFYTVRAGDTPARIAQKFYGSSQKYRIIMEANRLRDATALRVGQVLRIPAEQE